MPVLRERVAGRDHEVTDSGRHEKMKSYVFARAEKKTRQRTRMQ